MRVYNFAPGPSALPLPVLEKAAAEMTDYHGTGMSVMEMSHRGKTFLEIHARCQALLRELMHIPDNYKILFIQGGASMQFATIPLNLMTTGAATYIDSGNFAHNALVEAQRYGRVDVLASPERIRTTTSRILTWTGSQRIPHICISRQTIRSSGQDTHSCRSRRAFRW